MMLKVNRMKETSIDSRPFASAIGRKGKASAVPSKRQREFGFSPWGISSLAALFLSATLAAPVLAQAGGGGAAGAGTASGASGPGAASAAQGQVSGQAAGANGAANGQAQSGQTPQQYAAGASLVVDPRKKAPAKPGALTMEQAIELAKTKNPALLAAEATLRSVKAQEIQAAVRANPYFTLYGTNLTEGQDAGTPYGVSAQVSRLFERGGKRGWRIDDAKATTAQTQAQLEDQIRQTILTVKTAFTTMLIAKQAALLSQANLKEFGHEVEIANDRYKAGDLAKIDFERLDLQLGDFEAGQANDIIALQQASAQLQTLIGYDQPKPDFDITGEVVPPVVNETKDQVTQAALANRPDYAAARFGVQVADAAYGLAKANGTTDPTLEAEYDRNGPENSIGASINIPLRIFDKNQGNKETARFVADASRFTELAAKNQVYSDVEQAWVGYVQSKRLSDRFTDHYLDESTDVLKIAQFAFEHGGIALIDYLDALRDARSTVTDALNAYQNTWLAIHQLSASAGTEVVP
jgi:cobalt-zinc-cadmium efflux system outer membrane protein